MKNGRPQSCVVITDRETAIGFRLAGVEVRVSDSLAETKDHIEKLVVSGGCALLLVKGSLMEELGESFRNRVERAGSPVMIPLPLDMKWHAEEMGMEYLHRLIRRSIGYQLRLRK